jgi:hypothetical protein
MRFQRCLVISILLGPLMVLPTGYAKRANFAIHKVDITVVDGVYVVDAKVDYMLTKPVTEALRNGVRLVFVLEFEVLQRHDWWWNTEVADLVLRYRLKYHALSQQYVIENLNTGVKETYPDLASALHRQGSVTSLPLIDSALLERSKKYFCRIRTSLSVDELPLPLRVRAYLSSDWQLSTDWYTLKLP